MGQSRVVHITKLQFVSFKTIQIAFSNKMKSTIRKIKKNERIVAIKSWLHVTDYRVQQITFVTQDNADLKKRKEKKNQYYNFRMDSTSSYRGASSP